MKLSNALRFIQLSAYLCRANCESGGKNTRLNQIFAGEESSRDPREYLSTAAALSEFF